MQYNKITMQNYSIHPWLWILWKLEHAPLALNAAQTQQLWKILSLTGQAETKNPVRNCHSWDKEHQLMVRPALPAENPAINTSLLCQPFRLGRGCRWLCQRGSHHPKTQCHLLLLGTPTAFCSIERTVIRTRGSSICYSSALYSSSLLITGYC